MTTNFPYHSIPREARWREVVAGRIPEAIDPHFQTQLRIRTEDRIASAGSCFAQRISAALQNDGFNYLVTENGSPFLAPDERKRLGFGLYSARYGNVYTALQLVQLLRRAYGKFDSQEPLWQLPNGHWVDPYRPAVQEGGFATESECLWDRKAHLAAVRKMFEQVDVFIFTLGLTEAWLSRADGSVFPACPGSSLGGEFSQDQYVFHNFSVTEVVDHMNTFLSEFALINPAAQVILTVSPVPLMATYEPRHVLQATTYSKAVLRVAAEELRSRHANVHYFAAYEIVNHTGDSAAYFQEDLRGIAGRAVQHVIQCFHRQFTGLDGHSLEGAESRSHAPESGQADTERKPVCDEELVMAALADQAQMERSG